VPHPSQFEGWGFWCRLAQLDFKPCPASDAAISNAIIAAEKILRRIDSRWPKHEHDRDF
jgi:hypothetical protein